MINLEYAVSEQEYIDFTSYNGWFTPERKKNRVRYYLTNYFIFFGVFIVLSLITETGFLNINSIIALLIAGIILFFYLKYRVKRHYGNYVKKIISESGKDKVLPIMNLIISNDGIYAKDTNSEVKLKWSAFTKKVEQKQVYYLYLTSVQAIIIPKRVFRNMPEQTEFNSLLSENFPLYTELNNLNVQ